MASDDEILKGAFETTYSNLDNLLSWASAPLDTENYDQCWFNLAEDELRTISNAGEAVAAYCTFKSPIVEDIELHDSIDGGAGMEAIVKIPVVQDYLSFVGGERVRVEFWGIEDERGATKMVIDGDLRAEIFIPHSESDFNSLFLAIPKKYNDDDNWITSDETPLDTSFQTTADQFERIVDAVDFDHLALVNYPVVIRDGEFRLDASDENNRDEIAGTLHSEEVEGPDVENYYSRGIDNLFSGSGSISGNVTVYTEQDSLLNVVKKSNDDALTLRYAILPVA